MSALDTRVFYHPKMAESSVLVCVFLSVYCNHASLYGVKIPAKAKNGRARLCPDLTREAAIRTA